MHKNIGRNLRIERERPWSEFGDIALGRNWTDISLALGRHWADIGLTLPQGMCYSHYDNGFGNGTVSIAQWGLLSDCYKVNPIGQ